MNFLDFCPSRWYNMLRSYACFLCSQFYRHVVSPSPLRVLAVTLFLHFCHSIVSGKYWNEVMSQRNEEFWLKVLAWCASQCFCFKWDVPFVDSTRTFFLLKRHSLPNEMFRVLCRILVVILACVAWWIRSVLRWTVLSRRKPLKGVFFYFFKKLT